MAKMTNEFVQVAGHFQSFASEISKRLEKQGVNLVEAVSRAVQPENATALDDIAAVFAKLVQNAQNVFRLTKIGDGRTTDELVQAGNYDDADPDVTSRKFPVRRMKRGVRKIVLLEFGREVNSEEAVAEASKLGFERPTYKDALYFGVEHPDVQRERPVVFLHEPWRSPYGGLYVLALWGDAGYRELALNRFEDPWERFFRFAFVRPSTRA